MKLSYTVEGTGAGDAAFKVAGEIEGDSPIDPVAQETAMVRAFADLTGGAALFGHPGEGGCRGPYKVTRFELCVVDLTCSFDVLNPCWDARQSDVPGQHWGGGKACPQCTARAALAKVIA